MLYQLHLQLLALNFSFSAKLARDLHRSIGRRDNVNTHPQSS